MYDIWNSFHTVESGVGSVVSPGIDYNDVVFDSVSIHVSGSPFCLLLPILEARTISDQ